MDWFSSALMLGKVLFSFSLLFIFLPLIVTKFDEEDNSFLDRLFIPLIHSTVFIIVTVHILVSLQLFETISIIAVSLAGFLFFLRRRYLKNLRTPGTMIMTNMFDFSENLRKLTKEFVEFLYEKTLLMKKRSIEVILNYKMVLSLSLLTLGYAAYIRFHHSFTHLYFASADPYFHMRWAKYLQKNTIFVDGVYSYGFESIIAAISRFFLLDMYGIIRFIGPIAGMLMVLSIGFAVRKFGSNLYGVFLAMFVYTGFSVFPTYVWRQLSALPMEYSAIFFLPGVAFWTLYCRKGKRVHLLLASECLLLTLFLHPFATACLGISIAVIGMYYLKRLLVRKNLFIAALYMTIASLIGLLPFGIGLAAGIPFFSESINYIQSGIKTTQSTGFINGLELMFSEALKQNMMIYTIVLLLLILFCMFLIRRKKLVQPAIGLPVIGVIAILFLLIYNSTAFGLPVIMPADRFGVFFSMLGAMLFGIVLLTMGRILERNAYKHYLTGAISLIIVVSIILSGKTVAAPVGDRYQYDEAVKAYLSIVKHFDARNWTIVSTVDENPFVEAFGYHENIWSFVQNITEDNNQNVQFPFANTFFFVEKIPLGGQNEITYADALKPFPAPVVGDATNFYYRTSNRVILEAKLYNWLEWYRKTYPDKMSIYLDTPYFKVYNLAQKANEPPMILPKLPKEAEGVW